MFVTSRENRVPSGSPGVFFPASPSGLSKLNFPSRSCSMEIRGRFIPTFTIRSSLWRRGRSSIPRNGLLRGGDVRPPVPDAHILQRDVEAREEADPQPAADPDFHPQGVGGGLLQPGLERVHIHEENQRDRRQEEKRKEPPGREEGDFPSVGHSFSPTDADVAVALESDRRVYLNRPS